MTRPKSNLRLTIYQSEKSRWQHESKKHKLRLSQFVRIIVNGKLHIPTEDLMKKLERKHPDQMDLF